MAPMRLKLVSVEIYPSLLTPMLGGSSTSIDLLDYTPKYVSYWAYVRPNLYVCLLCYMYNNGSCESRVNKC